MQPLIRFRTRLIEGLTDLLDLPPNRWIEFPPTSAEAVYAVQAIGLADRRGDCGIAEFEREYQRYLTSVTRVPAGLHDRTSRGFGRSALAGGACRLPRHDGLDGGVMCAIVQTGYDSSTYALSTGTEDRGALKRRD